MVETTDNQEAKIQKKKTSSDKKHRLTADQWKTVIALSSAIVAIIVALLSMEKHVIES